VYASAASIWEISIKCALGKLKANPAEVLAGIEPAGFSHLSVRDIFNPCWIYAMPLWCAFRIGAH
jgi:PIN domain nuclease of toxin-antitoxin system